MDHPVETGAVTVRRSGTPPEAILHRRCHGTLDRITDSEHRALRSVGISAHDVAVRTGELLDGLVGRSDVRIFHGVQATGLTLPAIPHAVTAGRLVVLIEAVAWPPGCYEVASGGSVHCDGTYTGQSVGPLLASVAHWRGTLPAGHRVGAVVIVHPGPGSGLLLPAQTSELRWTLAADAVCRLGAWLDGQRRPASRTALVSLLEATDVGR
jgi:hypothetical protein